MGATGLASQTSTGNDPTLEARIPALEEESGFDSRQVLTDGTLVVLATVLGGAVLFVVNLYLARRFGPAEFGAFRLIISLSSLLVILVECGAGPTLIKYTPALAASHVRDLTRKVFAFRAAGYLGLTALILLLREPLTRLVFDDPALVRYTVAGAMLVFFLYFDIFRFLVVAHARIRLYAGSVAATFVANGALALAFGYLGGVFGAVAGWSLGYLVGNLLNIRFVLGSDLFARGERVDVRSLIVRYGLPMQVQQGIKNLELAVIPLASFFFDREAVGALALAMVFYRAIMLALTAFNAVLLPRFARLSLVRGQARWALRQGWLLYTPVAVLGTVAAIVLAEPLIRLVDPAYLDAALLLKLLLIYGLVGGYAAILISYAAGTAKVRLAILVTLLQQAGLMAVGLFGLKALGS